MVKLVFLVLAGLVAAAAGIVVLWPLFRGGHRRLASALVCLMTVATLSLYHYLGTPAALHAPPVMAVPTTLEEGVAQLQAALEREPQRLEGWVLLARSQAELGRLDDAATTWARALQLAPQNPQLLVEAAQARAQVQGQFLFDDTGAQWLQQAHDLAPDNERATWLLGLVKHQRGEAEQALRLWESLLPRLETQAAAALREQIDTVRSAAGLSEPAPQDNPAASPTLASGTHNISVQITLDESVQNRSTAAQDTLFVIARLVDGPPMPVAVQRHLARKAPLTLMLSDADSPMPTQNLSALSEVEVIVRLSASGLAARQDGDIESEPIRVQLPTDTPLKIHLPAP